MYDPKQFLGKRVYNDSELELLRTTVTCKTLTESERYTIMEQAVAPCPEITMIITGQKVRALLDMGSQVTLMNESYFLQNIQQLLPTVDKDHLNAYKLFNLKGVEDGCFLKRVIKNVRSHDFYSPFYLFLASRYLFRVTICKNYGSFFLGFTFFTLLIFLNYNSLTHF